ncbi:DsbA family oxidoreductase [Paraglaciecola arctica]|uniref:DsbA family oxidoreductase n=1 Tax=Paraglaciecola arctica TaxID=1128911 RepID=UPI001C06BE71|nr:DsbA family protein [Paraglaciecola arctica]MBU3005308.1 DsbA family protein [Paraglaciecola arctica]
MIKVEFYHDAVCGWCYIMSPRLRKIITKFNVDVVHRSFVLQRSKEEMIERFSSMENAKHEILSHWEACKTSADDPSTINIEGMKAAKFDYPSGYQAALFTKSAEILWGQEAHWDLFDAIQKEHLSESRNIADINVLLAIAHEIGLDGNALQELVVDENIGRLVKQDNARAMTFGIKTIPTIVIDGRQVISQAMTLGQLERLFSTISASVVSE